MWIEIFKTGTHKDSLGQIAEYTCEDLDEIARKYNSSDSLNMAPVVKGHPKDDAPAYAWVEKLGRRGEKLVAKLKDAQAEFIDEIRSGRYRSVSISLYPDLKLRHVGFLGAAIPAVKGLRPSFFEEYEDISRDITYDFTEEVDDCDFSDDSDYEDEVELYCFNEELEKRFNLLHTEQRRREFRNFAESQINAKGASRLLPVQADALVELLDAAENSQNAQLPDMIMNFVSGLAPIADFTTLNIRPTAYAADEFAGRKVDAAKLNLHNKIREFQANNPGINYLDALKNFTIFKN